jgi:hypothetical protein
MKKNMFKLLDDLKEARDQATDHYWGCDNCQKNWKNIDVDECHEYKKLKEEVKRIENTIESYKIDIR